MATIYGTAGDDTITPGLVSPGVTGGTPSAAADVISAGDGDDDIDGAGGNDTLAGGAGNDTLDGGTGADRMEGGAGDDNYVVDNVLDEIVGETSGGGVDRVFASVSYTLGANLNQLYLTGTADIDGTGNAFGNYMAGNSGDNYLFGLDGADKLLGYAGNDTLYGGSGADTLDGGSGGDRLVGGDGNDTFMIDDATDVIVEYVGGGVDTVISSVSMTLQGGLENATLTGTARSVSGNDADNVLTGTDADNALFGLAGNDTLIGLDGNDTLFGGTGNDRLEGGAGNDIAVFTGASFGYRLQAGANGALIVTDIDPMNGNEGTDVLYDVERLQFLDGVRMTDAIFALLGVDTAVPADDLLA